MEKNPEYFVAEHEADYVTQKGQLHCSEHIF